MTEQEFATSGDPLAMLDQLTALTKSDGESSLREMMPSDRKLRLLVAAVERAWWGKGTRRDRMAFACLEAYAEGTRKWGQIERYVLLTWTPTGFAMADASECVRQHNGRGDQARWAAILREIVGNPWQPVAVRGKDGDISPYDMGGSLVVGGDWEYPWLTPQVLDLSRAAYDEREADATLDPFRLGLLSDALEEAGLDGGECLMCKGQGVNLCDYREVLIPCILCGGRKTYGIIAHLRSPGPHVRGCWALDRLLGKE